MRFSRRRFGPIRASLSSLNLMVVSGGGVPPRLGLGFSMDHETKLIFFENTEIKTTWTCDLIQSSEYLPSVSTIDVENAAKALWKVATLYCKCSCSAKWIDSGQLCQLIPTVINWWQQSSNSSNRHCRHLPDRSCWLSWCSATTLQLVTVTLHYIIILTPRPCTGWYVYKLYCPQCTCRSIMNQPHGKVRFNFELPCQTTITITSQWQPLDELVWVQSNT